MLAYTNHTEREQGPMNARQIIRTIPPGGKRTDLDKAHEIIRKQQAEIKQLREQLSTAASVAAGLRLTANTAYENIVATIDEIEINRLMTTEERSWVKRLRRTAKNLDPYPEERDE